MKHLRTRDYLEHISQSSADIVGFTEGLSIKQFKEDRMIQKAVVMSLIEIGEAATKIASSDPEYVAEHSEVPWAQMRGMRNRIAHGYFDIDLDIVWETVRRAIPPLKGQIGELLR